MVDDLKQIPVRYKGQNIDLMLVHLGGTTIPSPSMPLLMVTMDAEQGLELVRLINPDLTIPIHYEFVSFSVHSPYMHTDIRLVTTMSSALHCRTSRKPWMKLD